MIRHTLEKADNILVVTHIDPDGDAIGSLTAVGLGLKQLGLNVSLVCDDAVPSRFRYLSMGDHVRKAPGNHTVYDLLIAVDCGDAGRMGEAYARLQDPKPFIINIDHHVTNTRFGEIDVIDSQATSTAEILNRLLPEWGIEITPEIALSLLTGLVTDTLGFRTVGVTANTLRTAADLIDAGADLGFVTMHALNLRAMSTLDIWRTGMSKMHLEDGLIWTSITDQERKEAQFRSNSSVGLVNLLANVEEAAMSAVLMEVEDGSIKVGFRCRPPYDVAVVAVELGGGGHPLASGCTLDGPLEAAETLVVRTAKAAILRQRPSLELIEESRA